MFWTGEVTFSVIPFLVGEGATEFNYFFTIMTITGMISFGIACLVKIISRS